MTEPTEDPQETYKRNLRMAERAHDEASVETRTMLGTVITFGSEALKAAALINGGSAAAMLAFIGTGRQPVTLDTIQALRLFGFGLFAATAATGGAYIAQYLYQNATDFRSYHWEYPFVRVSKKSRIFLRLGIAFHLATMLLVFIAYSCAVTGLPDVASTLVPMPAK
ncbi:hypothetical protein FV232_24645 [Methylobacterium sp. WL30]|uniref:hypothetical protein n=1 Tax=unclassified Methylobacterium TaxID=2615210 RepID=UPI0011CC665E|nr:MULTISPECIES: hypothetical protein [unclassified Methylobacterium]TXN40693.1 hypothetical protein FV225_05460 [Methylobacterium sp. WL93]TXN50017.1 hypothetical protein FV227_14145 [Methylobacterium sp. WL119]TXN62820.1 hypothetical protein FV232_24645 [Methylobacterium sp. WL30]